MHPAILANSFIDFYSEWPEAALLAVAKTFFKNNQLDKIIANTKSVATSSVSHVKLSIKLTSFSFVRVQFIELIKTRLLVV